MELKRFEDLFTAEEKDWAHAVIGIIGHVRPDGDCAGSCLGLMHYLKKRLPEAQVQAYLDPISPKFRLLPGLTEALEAKVPAHVDVLFVLDCSDTGRIGAGAELLAHSDVVICLDHHISNTGFGDWQNILPDASSTAEVLYGMMEKEAIEPDTATCLYTGLIHDTGVFRHSCTGKATMEAAGYLMSLGVPFTKLINETFYQKTYAENRGLGAVLKDAKRYADDRVIVGIADQKLQAEYGLTPLNLDGIVDQLNLTEGVDCTVFLYETAPGVFKASIRTGEAAAANVIADAFGGGGHARAAGCSLEMDAEEAVKLLLAEIEKQL